MPWTSTSDNAPAAATAESSGEALPDAGYAEAEASIKDILNRPEPSEETEDEPESDEQTNPGAQAEGEATEQVETPPAAEGPSAAMLRLARQSGIRDAVIQLAKSDADLDALITDAEANRAKDPEEVPELTAEQAEEARKKYDLPFSLAGEEYADDPYAKAIKEVVDKANENQRMRDDYLATALREVRELKEQIQNEKQHELVSSFQAPFDEVLDSCGSKEFGNTKEGRLSAAQIAAREPIWDRYFKLDPDARADKAELVRIVELALQRERPDVYQQHLTRQQQVAKQPKNRIGGKGGKAVVDRPTLEEQIQAIIDRE
jgi:hypothetical protein